MRPPGIESAGFRATRETRNSDRTAGVTERENDKCPGSETMNKSVLAGRVADRIGVSRSAAEDAVDAVFEAVGEALSRGEIAYLSG